MRLAEGGVGLAPFATLEAAAACVAEISRGGYPDPFAFRPERFLERPTGTYTWIPFGGGVRRCLGASFALKGLISSQATRNPMMAVNQVHVNMHFTLTGGGRIISEADAHSESYAGADVGRMALTLVNEQADEVVATLYSDYCRIAGAAPRKAAQK